MAGPLSNPFMFKSSGGAAAAAFYPHQIANSFRWDSGYLKFTPSSAGNRQTWTFSCWMKQSGTILNSQGDMAILNAGTSGHHADRFRLYFHTQQLRSSSNEANYNVSANLYRDPSAWMHIVWKLTGNVSYQYVNGVLITNESVSGNVAINNDVEHTMGVYGGYETASRFKGYLAEVVFIDGTALNPTSFASEKNGVWIPDDVSELTFGNQGYHLNFANASAPGNDVSGNNNDWTNVSLATHDQTLDSPTFGGSSSGNFATLNPTAQQNGSTLTRSADLSEGNLFQFLDAAQSGPTGTMGFNTTSGGKWYWEVGITNFKAGCIVGIVNELWNLDAEFGYNSPSSPTGADQCGVYIDNGKISQGGSGDGSNFTSYGSQLSAGDVVGVAVDVDNAKIWFSVNGTFINSGNPAGGSNAGRGSGGTITTAMDFSKTWFPCVGNWSASTGTGITYNFGQEGTFSGTETAGGNADANGFGNFFTAPPSGFLALCTGNLPVADAIDPAQTDDNFPQKLFGSKLYTGTGGNRAISGLGFAPDVVWGKSRSNAENHFLADTSHGTGKDIIPDLAAAQQTENGVTAFGTDGWSMGSVYNANNYTYGSWSWRLNGGTEVSNSDGGIASTVQVDPSGGFSLVRYSGTGSASTVGHGLSSAPTWIFAKRYDASASWVIYTTFMTAHYYMTIDAGAMGDDAALWNDTNSTSSVFSVGTGVTNVGAMTAFCWANVEGYIKSGSYEGNGNANGTFVYTGFRPAFIICKSIDSGTSYQLFDDKRVGFNVDNNSVLVDTNDAEATTDMIDILSNGFKFRISTDPNIAETYIYLAIAKNPFKYATAR